MKKILVVDDSKTFHMHVKNMLHNDYDIISCLNPNEAIASLEKNNPDIVLIDVEMPEMNGFELSLLIHQNKDLASIPVLIMTGSFSEDLILKAIESFAMDILPKNSSEKFLNAKIAALIRQKRLIEEHTRDMQLKAIKAMLVTNNHVINNALQVSDSALKKIRRNFTDQVLLELIAKGISSNDRIKDIVIKLNDLNSVELIEDKDAFPMLNLERKLSDDSGDNN